SEEACAQVVSGCREWLRNATTRTQDATPIRIRPDAARESIHIFVASAASGGTDTRRKPRLKAKDDAMPRIRKPSLPAFATQPDAAPELALAQTSQQVAATAAERASRDPLRFLRVMAEIERLRGQLAHPESPTRH